MNNHNKLKLLTWTLLALLSTSAFSAAKFEPEAGRILLFAGQDLNAIGNFKAQKNIPAYDLETPDNRKKTVDIPDYSDGYLNHFPMPSGLTTYTSLPQVWGLTNLVDYGAGPIFADWIKSDAQFSNTLLSLGAGFPGQSQAIAAGEHDEAIAKLSQWLKAFKRPVFLRVGFEYDYTPNNYGTPEEYIKAYRYIVDKLRADKLTNIAYVWQAEGAYSSTAFWPGEDYVDWVSFSAFSRGKKPPQDYTETSMFKIAEKHDKPIFIAEVAMSQIRIEKAPGRHIWRQYFSSWLTMFYEHPRIKAIGWINQDWETQRLWDDIPVWENTNTRLQDNGFIKKKWTEEFDKPQWINPSKEDVFKAVGYR